MQLRGIRFELHIFLIVSVASKLCIISVESWIYPTLHNLNQEVRDKISKLEKTKVKKTSYRYKLTIEAQKREIEIKGWWLTTWSRER